MREMWCMMADCAADARSVLCGKCCTIDAAMEKAGWVVVSRRVQPSDLFRCDGNPDLPCVACGYRFDLSGPKEADSRRSALPSLAAYREEVEKLKPSELHTLRVALTRMGEKILKACQQQADDPVVALSKIVAALQETCRFRKIDFADVLYTAKAVSYQIEKWGRDDG